MMRVWGLIFLFIGCGVLYFFNSSWNINNSPVPPLGKLLNPFTGIWQNAEDSTDFQDINLESPFVNDEIKIVFDDRMVPHIYANSLEDALFAQGYVEAYHRLFQMDLSARATDGKLSEILGEDVLAYDQKQLRLGLGYAADNAIEGWNKHTEELKYMTSYVQGINHYISSLNTADYPMEYKLLDFEPEEWTMRHSALILKAMSLTLAGYEEDVELSNALKLLGNEDFKLIFPEYNPKDIPVIQSQYVPTSTDEVSPLLSWQYNPSIDRQRSPEGVGSNNWAISAERTKNGYPILANDPHLGLSLPSVWYEIAIYTPEFSARGATLLGMPGIMIGFNEHIAWGETNVGHDVMDYHLIDWANDEKTKYYIDNQVHMVEYREEKFNVKGAEPVVDSVKYTIWGPVVDNDKDLALRWLAHDEAPGLEHLVFVLGMTCKNYDEYLEATGNFYCPAQNFVYADKHGEIGLRVNGNIPIKKKGQGRMVSSGSKSTDGWNGFVPREENPHERNPERGYVSSANQWSTSPDYPYYYNGGFEPYRGRIANEYLAQLDSATVQDAIKMQQSTISIEAREALPIMLDNIDSNFLRLPEIIELQNWDYGYRANSISASLYNEWFAKLHRLMWDEVYDHSDTLSLPSPDTWVTIQFMERYTSHRLYDIKRTKKTEALEDLIMLSLEQTLSDTSKLKAWGKVKPVYIPHLTRLPVFSSDSINMNGHKYSLNAMQVSFGPSWRMVVELADEPRALGIYPGGQSGNPGSYFYKNTINDWAVGNYVNLQLAQSDSSINNPLFQITIKHEE